MLLKEYGRVQQRCSDVIADQAARLQMQQEQIARMQREAMLLHAQVIMRESALAWLRQDMQELTQAIPGLSTRVTLARKVESLSQRIQDLMREVLRLEWLRKDHSASRIAPAADLRARSVLYIVQDGVGHEVEPTTVKGGQRFMRHAWKNDEDNASLEASLSEADLVICQTGCVSHDAYWRVQDHCKRTGKQCVLVDQPQALQFVRSIALTDVPTTS